MLSNCSKTSSGNFIDIIARNPELIKTLGSEIPLPPDPIKARKPKYASWQLGERLEGLQDAHGVNIYNRLTIAPLSNGGALIGGERGALYSLTKRKGKLRLSRIGEFKSADNECYASVLAISILTDGSALIGGVFGALSHAVQDQYGNYHLVKVEEIKDICGGKANVTAITAIQDGSALIACSGDIYQAIPNDDGSFDLNEIFKGEDDLYILSIAELPDGSVIAGGDDGTLYHFVQSDADVTE